MRNPYEDLFAPVLDNPKGEEVTGAFTCQEQDCWNTVKTARYLEELKVLTWKCSNGHINEIREFNL